MDTLLTVDRIIGGDEPTADARSTITGRAAVLVREGRIVAAGPAPTVRNQARETAVDLDFPGCTLLPGLINTHVHLAGDLSPRPFDTVQSGDRAAIAAVMERNAQAALRGGCTTVRDLGDNHGLAFALRDRIAGGELVGPRILAAGSPLTIPGGHCWFLGGEVADRDDIVRRIEQEATAGADLIKVMAGGGQMTPSGPSMYESQFEPDDLAFIVAEAGRRGLPVAAHAHATTTIGECVDAGVRTIEHCSWWSGRGEIGLCDDTARRMAASGIAAGDTTPPQWRMLAELMPFPDGFRLGDQLPWLHAHGVPILIGTDSGLPDAVFDDFPTSLGLYEERGFERDEILALATGRAADHLGLGDETGRIRPGLVADLLVVPGDPRDDLQHLRNPRLIMARGRSIDLIEKG